MKMIHKNHSRFTQRFNTYNCQPDIIRAIIRCDTKYVRKLLQMNNGEINSWIDYDGRTPLHLAAALGRDESLRILIDFDYYSINCRDNNLITPLHRACRNNHIGCVRLLLEHNADVNARTRTHLTPLHVCAQMGSLSCARLIIDHVANIDQTDSSSGATALHYAVYNSNLAIIQLLLENGANIDVQDKYGLRPIHYSAMVDNPAVLRILIEQGQADVNVRSKSLLTPLHIAIVEKNFDIFNSLLNYGADMNVKDLHGNTIAHWSAYIGYLPIFELIITNSTEMINQPNLNGCHPLHYACVNRSFHNNDAYHIVTRIISFYKNDHNEDTNSTEKTLSPTPANNLAKHLNVVDKFNCTPLHYVACNNMEMVITLLVMMGADYNACDYRLETPIHKAIQQVQLDKVKVLRKLCANINMPNKDGQTALHMAAFSMLSLFCRFLTTVDDEYNGDNDNNNNICNPMALDNSGRTAHYMTAYSGSMDCFYELIASATFNDKDPTTEKIILFPPVDAYKRSLLHYACANNFVSIEFIRTLLLKDELDQRFGSLQPKLLEQLKQSFSSLDINQQDIYGRTPLHYLCRQPDRNETNITDIIKLFIESGANIDMIDNENFYPFHYAIINGYSISLQYLINIDWFKNIEIYQKLFHSSICPLRLACYYGHLNVLNELLKFGFNDYDHAFEIAIRRSNLDCAQRLYILCRNQETFQRMLLFAARIGDTKALYLLFNLINNKLIPKEKLLMLTALCKQGYSSLKFLIFKNFDINLRDNRKRNALFYAIIGRNHQTIELLINSGIQFVNDDHCRNVFHLLAQYGDLETFQLLCNLSRTNKYLNHLLMAKDCNGYTPLEIACFEQHQNILEYYLNNFNQSSYRSLMFFAGFCHNVEFIQYILRKYGTNVLIDSRGPFNRTMLHYCCMSYIPIEDYSILKLLLELKMYINQPDEKGLTPLLYAAYSGNYSIVNYLLRNHSTDINLLAVDNQMNNILHLACLSCSKLTILSIIDYAKQNGLIENLINGKNHYQQIPLHLAAKKLMPTIIKELLYCGSSWDCYDQFGYSPSLYCTPTRLSAFCLATIETFMLPINDTSTSTAIDDSLQINDEQNDISNNNNTINDSSVIINNNNNTIINNDDNLNKNRLSSSSTINQRQRQSLPPTMERIKSYEQLICDKMSRLSLNKQPITIRSSSLSAQNQHSINNNHSIADDDSDTY
uniref:Alpha-latrotoxin n=1 Tax=Dermatophagoides pteronyssinus TaxID=6956 RepID=A0A6P6YAC6_DERPT|nr:serine/threonine-protein phosphatase 6 regulatory ankyrin repeat subunit B-like [Dermatophagoides pteronyssinus]